MTRRFSSFAEFYPFYLSEHSDPTCRRLHFAGSAAVLLILFSVKLPIFPIGAWGSVENIVLPGVALSLLPMAYIARLTRVAMIGNDMALDPGVGTCGKEGQSVPVGVGQPTLRIDGLTVGGTV